MCNAILLLSCPDKRGITATVTNFVYTNNGNILHAEQHKDEEVNIFFMRIEWSMDGFAIPRDKLTEKFQPIADMFEMKWSLYFTDYIPRMAIFVSKRLHCLYDLLLRNRGGQFNCDIALIISNHRDAKKVADEFGVRFQEFIVTAENKMAQEKKQIELLMQEHIDVVVLARYHQIFTEQFVRAFDNKIINIHHSFLPAFIGKNPYHQAYQKGVKLIGATSHYVTEKLDEGPIIEQDTARISHRDAIEDLVRMGEDLEKVVLGRAVVWHLQRKVLSFNNKTVVFE